MSGAEQELLRIYTRQAYDAYLSGNLRDCESRIIQMEALNKGDIHAVFLKGAVTGRKVKPGKDMHYIRDALQIWKPLYEQLGGETLEAMKAAIDEAFSTILYIPAELAARQWDVYCDARTARELADTVRTILDFDDSYLKQRDVPYSQWIHGRFVKNYVFIADEMIGMNKPVPVGTGSETVKAYGAALEELNRMAERIPDTGESESAVKQRASQRLEMFRRHNQADNRK